MIKARKKQEIGNTFFDWLFILHPSCQICIYLTRKKNKRTDPRIGSRWLAGKSFGWRSERNRCGEAFLTPSVTFGHVCLEGKKKKTSKMLLLLQYVPYSFNHEHLQLWTFSKKVDIYPRNSLRGHPIMNFALQEILVHAPISSLPFLYSPYLWFLIVA